MKFFSVRYKLCENHLRIKNFWITVISLKHYLPIWILIYFNNNNKSNDIDRNKNIFYEVKMLCFLISIFSSVSSTVICSAQNQIHSTTAAIFIEFYKNHQVKTHFKNNYLSLTSRSLISLVNIKKEQFFI